MATWITRRRTEPYRKRTYRGVTLDNRTISALEWAERHYLDVAPKKRHKFVIVQGSYNSGVVGVSKGTHDGGGALDLSVSGLNAKQIAAQVKWLRKAGFAAWFRKALPGVWGPHIHAILLGHRNASEGAKQQMVSYKQHRDGLAGNAYDQTWRPKVERRWSHRQKRPILQRG